MKKAILFMCSLCCVLGGTFTSYASEMQTNELVIVEEEQTAEAVAPTIFVADTSQIYTYTMMQNDIAQLTRMFPDKMKYEVVGQSTEGRDIYLLILGNPKAEHAVFVEGSIHGREYITTQLIMHMLLNYTVSYDTNEAYQEMLNNVCFYIVPMSNPDGVSISQLGEACTEDENRLNFLRTVYKADSTGYQSYANYLARCKRAIIPIHWLPTVNVKENKLNGVKLVHAAMRRRYLNNCTFEMHEGELKIALAKKIVKDKCPSCGGAITGAVNEHYRCRYCNNLIMDVVVKK